MDKVGAMTYAVSVHRGTQYVQHWDFFYRDCLSEETQNTSVA
jgi:hypothetical protein